MVRAESLGHKVVKRNGLRKAKVAVARKLAVIMDHYVGRRHRVYLVEKEIAA